jgi:H+-transporting ATPase
MEKGIIDTKKAKDISTEDLFKRLSSSSKGLSDNEAKERLDQFGPNEISEKKTNTLIKFLKYFWGPIPWMIEIALVLSAVLRHWDDFGVILLLLMINAVVRFSEEHRADNAIEMLKKRLAIKARVFRDGKWQELSAKELVPGDIIRVRLGDIIPADIKLVEGDYLSVDESALTGESLPVEKNTSDVGYSGSVIRQGEMDALVINTGMNTYFGKTTKLVEEAKTTSHFQKAVIKIGNYLIIMSIALVIIVFIVELLRQQKIIETLQFGLVLIIAAIPAALPAVLSVTMVVGATALARKDAIVSKLLSIEEMAGADILCSDKTGTITKNELSVEEIIPIGDFSKNEVLIYGSLASREEDEDPIDNAIINKSKNIKEVTRSIGDYKILDFKPFDPVKKRTESVIEVPHKNNFKVSKGAPQVIMSLVGKNKKIAEDVDNKVNDLAKDGYRALGIAKSSKSGEWKFTGLIGLSDTAREDSADTIKKAQSMGLIVKMLTGDHTAIAKKIAKDVNLNTNIAPASSLIDMEDDKAEEIIENSDGFSEVFPEHKYRIVELLQKKNHIVGMTGDGVNDAPALKKADIGIAVSGATDAAKSAAAIVFTRPGLSVIVDALRQSRKIFMRMNNYAIYRIAETIRVLFFLVISILAFKFYPLTTIMVVLLALLNDIPIMMISYDNTKLLNHPVRWRMSSVLEVSTILGIVGVISSFGFFLIVRNVFSLDSSTIQTLVFLKLIVSGHLTIYLTRTGKNSFWTRPLPSLKLFLTAEFTQIVATFFAAYGVLMTGTGWKLAGFVWGYAIIMFVATNYIKVFYYKIRDYIKGRSHKPKQA